MVDVMRVRAIAFDVDGTLYPASSLNLRCVDLFFAHPRFVTAFSSVRRQLRALQRDARFAPHDSESLHQLQAALLAERLGTTTEERARDLMERIFYQEIPRRFATISPYPGVAAALSSLRARGFSLAALSDLPPEEKLRALGLSGFFPRILCAEDTGALKPHPRVFEALTNALGIAPEEILYVGNNVNYDIGGSKAAGMGAALRGRNAPAADFRFARWDDFAAWARDRLELTE